MVARPVALTTWFLGGQLQLVGALTLVSKSVPMPLLDLDLCSAKWAEGSQCRSGLLPAGSLLSEG